MRTSATFHQRSKLAPHQLGDIDEWAERARSEHRVACAPQSPSARLLLSTELPDDRGFPDPRLTSDEHQPTLLGLHHRVQRLSQRTELLRPLQQTE